MDNALRTPSTNHPAAESITAKVAFSSNWPGTLNMHQHKEDILQDRYRSLTNHNLLLTAVCFTTHHLFCHKTIRSYCIIMMSHPITPQTSQLNKLVAKRKKKKKNNAKWAFKHSFFFFFFFFAWPFCCCTTYPMWDQLYGWIHTKHQSGLLPASD